MSRRKYQQEKILSSQESIHDISELSEDGKRIVLAIREEMQKVKDELLDQLSIKTKEIAELSNEVATLKERVGRLEERVEEAEAYERRDTLVISGKNVPPVVPGENCVPLVCDLLKSALKLNVSKTDFSTAHRIGSKPVNQQLDNRSIIMKLCRRDIKADILNACRQLKPRDLYMNESLTPTRSTIMYMLRSAMKKSTQESPAVLPLVDECLRG